LTATAANGFIAHTPLVNFSILRWIEHHDEAALLEVDCGPVSLL
jgi:hypothetical protein